MMLKKLYLSGFFLTILFLIIHKQCLASVNKFDGLVRTSSDVNSYELFFPTVAGTLPTDKKYILKLVRDRLSLIFTRNISDRVKISTNISDKRLLEAEQMLMIKKFDLAEKSLKQSPKFMIKALDIAKKAKKEDEVISVSLTILNSTSKQEKFLLYLANKNEGAVYMLLEQNYLQIEMIKENANELLFRYLHPGL